MALKSNKILTTVEEQYEDGWNSLNKQYLQKGPDEDLLKPDISKDPAMNEEVETLI